MKRKAPIVRVAFDNRRGINVDEIPPHVAMSLGQVFYEAVKKDFQQPEVRADYERWKAERQAKAEAEAKHSNNE